MNDSEKVKQLNNHKALATGLFVLMLLIYAAMAWLARTHPAAWIGYVKAFSEAAMVGALADWFAVTALFHHPLGIPIPHTNLIENSKSRIGDNLGNFVVSNFLNAGNIRPYIQKVKISSFVAGWLGKDKNKKLLLTEISKLLNDIVQRMDSDGISGFMARKGVELLNDVKLNLLAANALHFFLDNGEHQKLLTLIAGKVKGYISENEDLVREKVKGESYFFIPKFVDNKLAEKISGGLARYFEEIEQDPDHRLRGEITAQLYAFAERLRSEPEWQEKLRNLGTGLLPAEKLEEYAAAAWKSIKSTLQQELSAEDSALSGYFSKTLDELAENLRSDAALQQKIDGWIHFNAYRLILRNSAQVGKLISNTVGNWQGRDLSRKLELEVGKDLQFIRINGTVVGGLVGLVIYTITKWLG